jgi:glucose-6-phosphate isomerase
VSGGVHSGSGGPTSISAPAVFRRGDETPAWAALAGHFQAHGQGLDLREAFASDARRFERFGIEAPEVFADLSKNLLDEATRRFLLELAVQTGVAAQRDRLFAGAEINSTEGRAVLHTALRAPKGAATPHNAEVHAVLDEMLAFAESVRARAACGELSDVLHIGIGGSDLGPQMVVLALDAFAQRGLRLHFVSNVDGHDIASVLRGLEARRTLVVIASKTFTTQETMANAAVARQWFIEGYGQRAQTAIAQHFAATTTNVTAAAAFGITQTFGFWDWVGGRYSLWSAIGLPIAIAVGEAAFRELLAGAHAMDEHFVLAQPASNLPMMLGLLDVWYRNFHGFTSRSVAPYHQGLKRLPAFLQQLEMESNGKSVDAQGRALPYGTSPVVWGESGTNGQHAYFQMLHQGTDVVPVEFILVKRAAHPHANLHAKLLANGLAQSQALMLGKSAQEAMREKAPTASAALDPAVLAQHRRFAGNRPSTTFVLPALTPRSLGALLAMYEHRVFTTAAVWGINAFDQWGVELGKALCNALLPRLDSGDVRGLDGSTAGLLQRLR